MRLLVIRTSAMGDVALTTPVLRAVIETYPDAEIVLLTRPSFKPFFGSMERLTLFTADLKNTYSGLPGLIKLFRDLSATGKFDAVIDLHDVLRSQILKLFFRMNRVPAFTIRKGRGEKRKLISGKDKRQLAHTVERYAATFAAAGYPVAMKDGPWIIPAQGSIEKITSMTEDLTVLKIGVAPYARHKLKVWPEENMLGLIGMLSRKYKARFFLFGGLDEKERLEALHSKIPGSVNVAGMLDLYEEIALMSGLDLMIAMDSSNMHMAALLGVKVISIWGGTDPLTGFGAWMQPEEYFIRIPVDELTCRPCTIFGKGECSRGDLACMMWLKPENVFGKIDKIISESYPDKRFTN